MATLIPKNPRIVKSGAQPVKVYLPATGSQTWEAGEFATESSGLVTLVASDAVDVKYYLPEAQSTATAASEEVAVIRLSNDIIFEGNELDGTITSANVGKQYGIDVTSNLVTVDVGDTTNKAIEITDVASRYEPSRNDAADVKALCRFKFINSVIEA